VGVEVEWISFSSLKPSTKDSFKAFLSAPSDVAEFFTNADLPATLQQTGTQGRKRSAKVP
jgi:hypothetical protein